MTRGVGGEEWAFIGGEGVGGEYFCTSVRLWFEVADMIASATASTAASHPVSSSASSGVMKTSLR